MEGTPPNRLSGYPEEKQKTTVDLHTKIPNKIVPIELNNVSKCNTPYECFQVTFRRGIHLENIINSKGYTP